MQRAALLVSVFLPIVALFAACRVEEEGRGVGGAGCPTSVASATSSAATGTGGAGGSDPCTGGLVACPICSYGGMDTPAGEIPPPCPELRLCCAAEIVPMWQCASRAGTFLTLGDGGC